MNIRTHVDGSVEWMVPKANMLSQTVRKKYLLPFKNELSLYSLMISKLCQHLFLLIGRERGKT